MKRRSFLKVMAWFGLSYGTVAVVCLASACYKGASSNLPGCPKNAEWPDPCAPAQEKPDPYEFCTVIGMAQDLDSGVRDDAGVWHYQWKGISYPCDAGVTMGKLGKDVW